MDKTEKDSILLAHIMKAHILAFYFIFKKCIYFIFIYFWLRWVFVAAHGLSLVAVSRRYSLLQRAGFHCGGFSCCGAQALERRLSSCGARA